MRAGSETMRLRKYSQLQRIMHPQAVKSSSVRRLPVIREGSAHSSFISKRSKWTKASIKSSEHTQHRNDTDSDQILEYFPCKRIHEIMQEILKNSSFKTKSSYDSRCCGDEVRIISDEIRNQVKLFLRDYCLNRYKIVVNVIAGTSEFSDMIFASRFVWNPEKDTFVEAKLQLNGKYIVAVLYAVHHE
ncbi:dynein light chain Tctex-type 5-like [Styela clava]|uniref:tctex1 domain-containing protein 1-like n=1 Tax=Styela clava TaxID=7725 RepID=UPI00193989DC|nr:tctex1 domain-containing protein 1-like [Styela clava]